MTYLSGDHNLLVYFASFSLAGHINITYNSTIKMPGLICGAKLRTFHDHLPT